MQRQSNLGRKQALSLIGNALVVLALIGYFTAFYPSPTVEASSGTMIYAGRSFYISSNGNDNNDGLSPSAPWKTPSKVSRSAFAAGDQILFKCGDVFTGEISKTGGFPGTASQPIVIGSYGAGAKPIIYGDLTGCTWEAAPGRPGYYKTFIGYCVGSIGYEFYSGAWHVMKENQAEAKWYLSNQDSLKSFLDGIVVSGYGAGLNDTVWVRTTDGNSPNVQIFHEGNFVGGSYVTVKDLEFRNCWSAVKVYGARYCTYRNLTTRNTLYCSLFLVTDCRYCTVEYCTVDAASYTALYDYQGSYNVFRYNTVNNVTDGILGITRNSERCGIGLQEDNAIVVEYNTFNNIFDSGVDTYLCQGDTVRLNTVTNTLGGIWLNGNNFVAYGNDISLLGSGGIGIDVTNHGPGTTTVTNNIIRNTDSGLRVDTRENGGTTVFAGNQVSTAASNHYFTEFMVSGVISTNNVFGTIGSYSSQGMNYSSLAVFQSATGLENGSTISATIPVAAAAPVLSSPGNSATGVAINPTMNWSVGSGATSYRLQVSTNSGFATLVYDQSSLTGTSQAILGLVNNSMYYWRVNATNAMGTSGWSTVWNFTTVQSGNASVHHRVRLQQGYSMISTFVAPEQLAFDSIFSDIKPKVGFIKDGSGKVYIPSLGINQLGSWNSTRGYQVYMSSADTVTFRGMALLPEQNPVPLPKGWNLVSYLRCDSMAADQALSTIDSALVVAKNAAGQVYIPSYGINTIGTMKPGQGYQVYLQSPGTLTYPVNTDSAPATLLNKKQGIAEASHSYKMEHYKIANLDAGPNGTIVVKCRSLRNGDEVAVFTSDGKIAGAGIVTDGLAPIIVWGDDDQTAAFEGPRDGDRLTLTSWSKEHNQESRLEIGSMKNGLTGETLSGSLVYRKDCVWILEVSVVGGSNQIPTECSLEQNYPNPFNPSTVIRYALPFEVNVRLDVFDITGRLLTSLVHETQKAGTHEVRFDGSGVASGSYFYRLQAGPYSTIRKFLLVK